MAFRGGQDVGAFSEEVLHDISSMPLGLEFVVVEGIVMDFVGKDEVSFVK
jgi:hypothetical protein